MSIFLVDHKIPQVFVGHWKVKSWNCPPVVTPLIPCFLQDSLPILYYVSLDMSFWLWHLGPWIWEKICRLYPFFLVPHGVIQSIQPQRSAEPTQKANIAAANRFKRATMASNQDLGLRGRFRAGKWWFLLAELQWADGVFSWDLTRIQTISHGKQWQLDEIYWDINSSPIWPKKPWEWSICEETNCLPTTSVIHSLQRFGIVQYSINVWDS